MQIHREIGILPGMQPHMHKVRYLIFEQDGAFVAQCLDVDVASEGDTEEEAGSRRSSTQKRRPRAPFVVDIRQSRPCRSRCVTA